MRIIKEVTKRDVGGFGMSWIILYEEDGYTKAMGFPYDIFANRAAEYGYDYEEFDALWDSVVHTTLHDVSVNEKDEDFVYKNNIQDARNFHETKIAEAKSKNPLHDPGRHTEVIRNHHLSSYEVCEHAWRENRVWNLRKAHR